MAQESQDPRPEKAIIVWEGAFASWQDACQASGGEVAAFSSQRWLQRITQLLQNYREEYTKYGTALPPRPTNLPWVCAMTSPQSVADFGGSSGWCWDYLRNTVPELAVENYTVVETDQTVEHMQRSGFHTVPVEFATLKEISAHRDLLYSNSLLQYFGSNSPLSELVEKTTPKYILLDDLPAIASKDSFSRQRDFGNTIPYRFIGLQQLLFDLKVLGYHPYVQAPYISPVLGLLRPLPTENLPDEYRIRYTSSLLFRRVGPTQ